MGDHLWQAMPMNDSENGDFTLGSLVHWSDQNAPVEGAAWLILNEQGEPIAALPAQD